MLEADINGLEIGSTTSGMLRVNVFPPGVSVALSLSAEEARWLAGALRYWADVSEGNASPPFAN
ncbi:hypothetical protein HN018_19375 [Lichenicola cladoniae]|uniref:Uncharacterized protein n=1 Tax=Lichenicola cladoniae TaxID=1484109 RepID=A0A6M8HE18_9PROT|nr:hypothetical protein [Lichenicola cladoniae]NPD70368.1 hypothetical protein [Acetobacteraceae bacterium]QKE88650.1 hypothetical protein HN018_19375 [Lichenicola cladoniae]